MQPCKTLGIVLAHGAAKETVLRHLPYWFKVCGTILLVTPVGQKLQLNLENVIEYEMVVDGGSYSTLTNQRTFLALDCALNLYRESPYEYFILFEYDSLCWGPIPDAAVPPPGAMSGIVWPNEKVTPIPGKPFKGNFYLHFPHIYSAEGLALTVKAMKHLVSMDAEWGYTDRYIGLAVERAKVPVVDTRKMGLAYSYENISKHPDRVLGCIEAVKKGAIFTHGIKDKESLDLIAKRCQWGVL